MSLLEDVAVVAERRPLFPPAATLTVGDSISLHFARPDTIWPKLDRFIRWVDGRTDGRTVRVWIYDLDETCGEVAQRLAAAVNRRSGELGIVAKCDEGELSFEAAPFTTPLGRFLSWIRHPDCVDA